VAAVASFIEVLAQSLKDLLATLKQRRNSMPLLDGDNGSVLRRRLHVTTYQVLLVSTYVANASR
jgi:fibrillarin-like rRNA methylase